MLWSIIVDYFKDIAEEYVDSAKDRLFEISQKVYIFIIIYVSSILMLCFSISGLIQRFAEALDSDSGFYWRHSMTLYSIVITMSAGVLYYLSSSRKKRHASNTSEKMIEDKIDRIIKQKMQDLKEKE